MSDDPDTGPAGGSDDRPTGDREDRSGRDPRRRRRTDGARHVAAGGDGGRVRDRDGDTGPTEHPPGRHGRPGGRRERTGADGRAAFVYEAPNRVEGTTNLTVTLQFGAGEAAARAVTFDVQATGPLPLPKAPPNCTNGTNGNSNNCNRGNNGNGNNSTNGNGGRG